MGTCWQHPTVTIGTPSWSGGAFPVRVTSSVIYIVSNHDSTKIINPRGIVLKRRRYSVFRALKFMIVSTLVSKTFSFIYHRPYKMYCNSTDLIGIASDCRVCNFEPRPHQSWCKVSDGNPCIFCHCLSIIHDLMYITGCWNEQPAYMEWNNQPCALS